MTGMTKRAFPLLIGSCLILLSSCVTGGLDAALARNDLKHLITQEIDAGAKAERADLDNAMADAAEAQAAARANFERLLAGGVSGDEAVTALDEYEAAKADIAIEREREWAVRTDRLERLDTLKYAVEQLAAMQGDVTAAMERIKAAVKGEVALTGAHGIQLMQQRAEARAAEQEARRQRREARKASDAAHHAPPAE